MRKNGPLRAFFLFFDKYIDLNKKRNTGEIKAVIGHLHILVYLAIFLLFLRCFFFNAEFY